MRRTISRSEATVARASLCDRWQRSRKRGQDSRRFAWLEDPSPVRDHENRRFPWRAFNGNAVRCRKYSSFVALCKRALDSEKGAAWRLGGNSGWIRSSTSRGRAVNSWESEKHEVRKVECRRVRSRFVGRFQCVCKARPDSPDIDSRLLVSKNIITFIHNAFLVATPRYQCTTVINIMYRKRLVNYSSSSLSSANQDKMFQNFTKHRYCIYFIIKNN